MSAKSFAFLLSVVLLVSIVFAQPGGKIISLGAANMQTFTDFVLEWVDPSTGARSVIGNVTNVGGCLPGTFSYLPGAAAVQFLTLSTTKGDSTNIVTINATNDHVVQLLATPLVASNIAYDINLKQTFVEAYINANNTDAVYSLNAGTTTLQPVVSLGHVKEEVCISTYCPNGHIFFMLQQTNSANDKLVRVDVVNKKVASEVVLKEAVEILMWDYDAAVMYAWVATSAYAGELITLNITSGVRNSTIVSFKGLSANGGASTIDLVSKKVYASLLGGKNFGNPIFVTVDIASKNVTQTPAGIFHIGMNYVPPAEVEHFNRMWKL